jgi:excinuclease ABC subunit C
MSPLVSSFNFVHVSTFPFRDKCTPRAEGGIPCFNYQIGLCPGTCTGAISKKEYARTIQHLKTFFEGNKKKLIADLEKEMRVLAKARDFEKASEIKRKLFALKHIQDVALIKKEAGSLGLGAFRIEAYDIAHISGTSMVGVMVVVTGNEAQKSDYRMFKIRGQNSADDTRALKEVLERRLNHLEWPYPNLIVVDGGLAQLHTASRIIDEQKLNIPIVAVTKDDRHKPLKIQTSNPQSQKIAEKCEKEILLANSEAHRFAIKFHRKLRDSLTRDKILG